MNKTILSMVFFILILYSCKPDTKKNNTIKNTNQVIKTNNNAVNNSDKIDNVRFLVVLQDKNKILLTDNNLKSIKNYESDEFINAGMWSSKTKKAVFLSTKSDIRTISLIDLKTDNCLKIRGKWLSKPSISSSGKYASFVRIKNNEFGLNIINLEENTVKTVFKYKVQDIIPLKVIQKCVPVFSNNNRLIAFPVYQNENYHLYIYNIETAEYKKLTYGKNDNYYANFSPDSRRIIYISKRENTQIFTMRINGKSRKRLTFSGANKSSPGYSPDGKKIAYISQYKKTCRIYVMNSKGDYKRVIRKSYNLITYCKFLNNNVLLYKTTSGIYKININTREDNNVLRKSFSFIAPSQ